MNDDFAAAIITNDLDSLRLRIESLPAHPRYTDVPLIVDRAKSDDDHKVMELMFIGQELGRPFFAPPDIPADRAKALQDAFAKVMDDPEFQQGDYTIHWLEDFVARG